MCFAISSWVTPCPHTVYCVDASLDGHGVRAADLPPQEVGSIGGVRERDRWKPGGTDARIHSLETAGFAVDTDGKLSKNENGKFVKLDEDLVQAIRCERWERHENSQKCQYPSRNPKCGAAL